MQAREVMSEGVLSVPYDATVLQAAEMLLNTRVSAMLVLDNQGTMVGIVSLADLIGAGRSTILGSLRELADDDRSAATHRLAESTPVAAVMTKDVIGVAEDASLLDVVELMQAHKVKRVPVMRGGKVVGIVSRVDVLKALISYAAPGNPRGPSAPATAAADNQLRDGIIAGLGAVPGLSIQRADVVVKAGVAHLWGVVPNDMTRRSAVALVQKVPGVKSVLDHMHVAAGWARR